MLGRTLHRINSRERHNEIVQEYMNSTKCYHIGKIMVKYTFLQNHTYNFCLKWLRGSIKNFLILLNGSDTEIQMPFYNILEV